MTALNRFVAAQAPVSDTVMRELHDGAKRSHWMWFVFPQIAGLGVSETARRYAITSLEEARAYLAHPLLGTRLRDCVAAVLAHDDIDPARMFGEVDAVKLRSSLTLFEAAGDEPLFAQALDRLFGGQRDGLTLVELRAA